MTSSLKLKSVKLILVAICVDHVERVGMGEYQPSHIRTTEENYMKIEVINESCTFSTRERDESDSWDRGNTDTNNYIKGIIIPENERYYDLDTEFDVELGKEYYLLYAEYGTGDSFGSDGGQISFILLYKTLEKALVAQSILEVAKGYSAVIKTEDGKDLTYSIPWNGYFESLDKIDVEFVRLDTSYEATRGY